MTVVKQKKFIERRILKGFRLVAQFRHLYQDGDLDFSLSVCSRSNSKEPWACALPYHLMHRKKCDKH